jgi:hypothetical protein
MGMENSQATRAVVPAKIMVIKSGSEITFITGFWNSRDCPNPPRHIFHITWSTGNRQAYPAQLFSQQLLENVRRMGDGVPFLRTQQKFDDIRVYVVTGL